MDHEGATDTTDATTAMVVGGEVALDAEAAPPATPAGGQARDRGEDATGGRGGRARWVLVAAVLVVVAVGAVALARPDPRPDVQVRTWYGDTWVAAPAAPDGPVTRRWSQAVPTDRELVGTTVLDDRVVVATRDRRPSPEGDHVTVEALDTRDGRRLWRRDVTGWRTVVAVADDDTTRLLANVGAERDPEGRWAWFGSELAVLDPADGDLRWRTELPDEGGVELTATDTLVVATDDAVRSLDPLDGTVRLEWPTFTEEVDGGEGRRSAWLAGDDWVVPTADGWALADSAGRVEFRVDDPSRWPTVHDDVVVLAGAGPRVTVLRRPSGEVAWEVDLGDDVLWTQRLDEPGGGPGGGPGDRTGDDEAPGEPVRLVAWVDDGGTVGGTPVLVEQGRVVGPTEEPVASVPWAELRVSVDGRRLRACRQVDEPVGPGAVPAPCPAELAVLDADGGVVAGTEAVEIAEPHGGPDSVWRATDSGVLLLATEAVELRRWDDLAVAWEVRLTGVGVSPVTVATNAHGVAVAVPDTNPDRVEWYG